MKTTTRYRENHAVLQRRQDLRSNTDFWERRLGSF